jgi:glycosyltransferase involved in cell wall biosynthesis
VASRNRKRYGREATVIYPPVDVKGFQAVKSQKEDFFLTVSRMVPYKRVDLIVRAFRDLGLPLKVVGDGPERGRIEKIASDHVEMLGAIPSPDVVELMAKARAFVFAADEDFGITPVEAQAAGCPVIAYGRGGVRESVRPLGGPDEPTGVFFDRQTPESLAEAVRTFVESESGFRTEVMRRNASRFGRDRFLREIRQLIDQVRSGSDRSDS